MDERKVQQYMICFAKHGNLLVVQFEKRGERP